MAELTLTIGTVTATKKANNTRANNIIAKYADSIGATGTNQQRADAVLDALIRHMIEQGGRTHINKAMETAAQTVEAEIKDLDWKE